MPALILSALLWSMALLLLAQAYLAGGFLMGGLDTRAAHEGLGYMLAHFYPVLIVVVALVAGMGWRFWLLFVVLLVLLQAQPVLTYFRAAEGLGWLRALHPMNGTLILLLAVRLALTARTASRS